MTEGTLPPIVIGCRVFICADSSETSTHDLIPSLPTSVDSELVGRVGLVVEICEDDDTAQILIDGDTHWVPWGHLQRCPNIGWDFCQKHIPMEERLLLEAFTNLGRLSLSHGVKHRILRTLPDLDQRIRKHLLHRLQAKSTTQATTPQEEL
ncbi:MAG: hypothetical protein EA401_12775 [Planctomycetota bacterium]|nr:MAG: hypothetical protein EA401_12775 [Planctomycetota bacterium]